MKLEDLDTLRESWDFEAKLAGGRDGRGSLPDSVWETYSAMANAEGGWILLGAKERKDGSLELRGCEEPDQIERDLWNLLQNPQKVSANLLRRADVERIELESRALLLLRVPKANRSQRPVYLNGSWQRGTYIRVHDGDRRLDPDVVRRMLADSVTERDAGGLEDYGLADLNTDSVRRYREFFAARRPDHPFLQESNEAFLIAVSAARRKRDAHGAVYPTWAGLWMLGKEAAIRELLPHWHLSYKELPDDPGDGRRWLDRVYPDGTWNANVFEFYLRVISKLQADLKVPFQLEQGQFRVDETPVHGAVREALVNALVHADYQGTTGVRSVRRRSGYEFINPGLLLVTPEQVWRGGVSEPRNPALQRLFSCLHLGEREGSGGPTMRRTWRAQHWRAPRIWEDVEHCETHLQLPLESLLPESAVETLTDRVGAAFTKQDELGRVTLVTAEVEGSISHARMRELSDAHSRDITLKLQELVRHGLLESSGKTRGTTYSPRTPGELPLFAKKDGDPRSPPQSSASPPQSPPQSSASPPQSPPQSPPPDSPVSITHDTSGRIAASKWSPAADIRAALLSLCNDEYRTVVELARALNREPTTIQQNYVSKMVREGVLEALYPDIPSHPAQAYRAAVAARSKGIKPT